VLRAIALKEMQVRYLLNVHQDSSTTGNTEVRGRRNPQWHTVASALKELTLAVDRIFISEITQ
jgi:hypothetical protein